MFILEVRLLELVSIPVYITNKYSLMIDCPTLVLATSFYFLCCNDIRPCAVNLSVFICC